MFNIGDKVIVNGYMDGVDFHQVRGVVRGILEIGVNSDRFDYGIDFDGCYEDYSFHDLEGTLPRETGYYIRPSMVTLVEKYVKPKTGFATFVNRIEND